MVDARWQQKFDNRSQTQMLGWHRRGLYNAPPSGRYAVTAVGFSCAEVAGHHQGGEIFGAAEAPQHHRIQRMLPEGQHRLGEYFFALVASTLDWLICLDSATYLSNVWNIKECVYLFIFFLVSFKSWWWSIAWAPPPIYSKVIFFFFLFFLGVNICNRNRLSFLFLVGHLSSQETTARGGNRRHYPRCLAGTGLLTFPQHDSQVGCTSL